MSQNNAVAEVFIRHARHRLMKDYYPKMVQCIDVLNEEDIWWRPNEISNSAGNLLLHLCGNMRQWIIHGIGKEKDVRERPEEFAEKGPIPKKELMNKLDETLLEVEQVLKNFDTSSILEPRTVQGYEENCLSVIFHVVEHFAQHLGQIIYITKMRQNVDLKFFNL